MGLKVDFSKVISKLENIEKKASKEMIDEALKKGGKVVLEELKKEVRSNVYDTGELYGSLELGNIKGSGTNKKIQIGSQSDDRDIKARNYYNENGNTFMMGKKQNKKAFKNSKKEAKEAIVTSIVNNLKE
ncbi:MAG: HK97 gp10 family phage protein [Paraclostridium sp.]